MWHILAITFMAAVRDRLFVLILSSAGIYLLVPVLSTLSMRQATEVSVTLCLSLHASILLFLALFGGTATIWRDIERKYTTTILAQPLSRTEYFIGRFLGFTSVMLAVAILNLAASAVAISLTSHLTPSSSAVSWPAIAVAFFMLLCKYVFLMAFGCFFTSLSTSFYLPFFATIGTCVAGNVSQSIYDFVMSGIEMTFSSVQKSVISAVYYVVPNLSAFDYTAHAAYATSLRTGDVAMTLAYFLLYTSAVLAASTAIFNRRELG